MNEKSRSAGIHWPIHVWGGCCVYLLASMTGLLNVTAKFLSAPGTTAGAPAGKTLLFSLIALIGGFAASKSFVGWLLQQQNPRFKSNIVLWLLPVAYTVIAVSVFVLMYITGFVFPVVP